VNATPETATIRSDARSGPEGRLAFVGLMAIQIIIGYEWLMSGLTKIVRGGFPSGLADDLRERSEDAAGWYKSFLDATIIPNAKGFGILIEIGELAIGVSLIAAAAIWLTRRSMLSERARTALAAVTFAAAVGAILMNINLHLASGTPHPWEIPTDVFNEGVDLDTLLPLLELVLAAFSAKLLLNIHRERLARTHA
jgi:thiosulfate dehydrogenase [quinone] large subunit